MVVQVNGKVRGRIRVEADLAESSLLNKARAEESVYPHMVGREILKNIIVPGRLVNFVVK